MESYKCSFVKKVHKIGKSRIQDFALTAGIPGLVICLGFFTPFEHEFLIKLPFNTTIRLTD